MAQARHIGKIVIAIRGHRLGGLPGSAAAAVVERGPVSEHASATTRRHGISAAYVSPNTPTEKGVAGIWQDLLGTTPIGVHDDFFQLRGDSLLVAQVVSRINKTFQTKLPLSSLFDAPTVASLAERIQQAQSPTVQSQPELLATEQEEGVIE